jgi:UDP-glucose 4-epimerase
MTNYKFLVTGGSGFIGSHLVENLIEKGHKVLVVDDLSSGFKFNLNNVSQKKNFRVFYKKIQNIDIKKLGKINGIFHLAAQTSVQQSIAEPWKSSSNNLHSSLKVFEIARIKKIPIVYASSSAIYGNLENGCDENDTYDLISPYAFDKYSMEKLASVYYSAYKTRSIGLRFFNVYGPRQDPNNPYSGVISIFSNQLLNSKKIRIFGGKQTRDFIYVSDIVQSLMVAMTKVRKKNICDFINIGTGKQTSIIKLYSLLNKKINNLSKISYLNYLGGDPLISNGSFRKMRKILGLNKSKFTPLNKGLQETIEYFTRTNK